MKALAIRFQRSHVIVMWLDFEASLKHIVPIHSKRAYRVVQGFRYVVYEHIYWVCAEGASERLKNLTLWLKLAILKWKCELCPLNGKITWTMTQMLGQWLNQLCKHLIIELFSILKACKVKFCNMAMWFFPLCITNYAL